MPSSTYRPLTGKDIRDITINRLTQEVNKLPYLREGNSFHNVNVQFAFVMTAYPDDVPVPNAEISFDIKAELDEIESSKDQTKKAEELAKHIEFLENELEKALSFRSTLIVESEVNMEFDGVQPDKTRVENGLPVTVEKIEHGKRVETKISPIEFKKMSKI